MSYKKKSAHIDNKKEIILLNKQLKEFQKKADLLEEKNNRLYKKNNHLQKDKDLLNKRNTRLEKHVQQLKEKLHAIKLMLEEYRQMIFKKKALKHKKKQQEEDLEDENNQEQTPKKRGAPKGHPGTTRKTPDRVDEYQDIHLNQCPQCQSEHLSLCNKYDDHYQEDIVIPEVKVTRFRHHYYYCHCCGKVVHGTGIGEMPGSFIGPTTKSMAAFLRYHMALSYRKIQTLFKEAFNMDFDASSCVGFDKQIRTRGQPLYEWMKEELKNKPVLNVDETGWVGEWLWCYAHKESVVYVIREGRGQKEVKEVLGDMFKGVLTSDLLSAYNKIQSKKQKCLVHVLRLIKKWNTYYDHDKQIVNYFATLKNLIKDIIALSESMQEKLPKNFSRKKAELVGQLRKLLNQELTQVKANKFRKRLRKHFDELVTCLDFIEVCSHNNFAERCLRPNVIMRKITFGNKFEDGKLNHEVIMSLLQTARLQDVNPLTFFHTLLTNKSAAALSLGLGFSK